MKRDRRLTPARPDLAATYLRGEVEAARFVEGRAMRVAEALVDLRRDPQPDGGVETQALFGERVMVYEDYEGWAWAQLSRDSYVGYLPDAALAPDSGAPTHRVAAPWTFLYPAASMKLPRSGGLPLGALVQIAAEEGAFARLATGGFVWRAHLVAVDHRQGDFVAVAEMFLNAPYLWGGKSWRGVDCSGLVQIALNECGLSAPRDTDLQEQGLGAPLPVEDTLAGLKRGDLVFWKGHVGIMRDAETLLHANGYHMLVVSEPLAAARKRILAAGAGDVTSVRRLG